MICVFEEARIAVTAEGLPSSHDLKATCARFIASTRIPLSAPFIVLNPNFF